MAGDCRKYEVPHQCIKIRKLDPADENDAIFLSHTDLKYVATCKLCNERVFAKDKAEYLIKEPINEQT